MIRGLGGLTSNENDRKHINRVKGKATTALLALALMGLTVHAGAQDKEPAVNPTGMWESTITTATGQPASSQTLKQ